MAAEVLATAGVEVHVYEHMPSVGRKFQLAGRSGLNITHSEPTTTLIARYMPASRALSTAIQAFDAQAVQRWCIDLGEPTFVGSSGRVFPTAMRATPLLRAWLARLNTLGVEIHARQRWTGWARNDNDGLDRNASEFEGHDGTRTTVAHDVLVLALGGASWPRVGSDGLWATTLAAAGIEVILLAPSNCGVEIAWSEVFRERFEGVPLKQVVLSTADGNATLEHAAPDRRARGDVVVTRNGLESGPIYSLSRVIRERLQQVGHATLHIDLCPDLDRATIETQLQRARPKDSLTTTLRRTIGLAPVAMGLLREATGNQVPRDPPSIAQLVKNVPLRVNALAPIDRAISSAGGVGFNNIDERFMLKTVPGTFVVGEMLDWEAPTGGYLLQATFSTAVRAATAAVTWLDGHGQRTA